MLTERIIVIRVLADVKLSSTQVGELVSARAWEIDGVERAELMVSSDRLDIEAHHVDRIKT